MDLQINLASWNKPRILIAVVFDLNATTPRSVAPSRPSVCYGSLVAPECKSEAPSQRVNGASCDPNREHNRPRLLPLFPLPL